MSTLMPEAAKKRGNTVRYIYAAQILLFTIRYRLQIMSTNPTEICSSRKKKPYSNQRITLFQILFKQSSKNIYAGAVK